MQKQQLVLRQKKETPGTENKMLWVLCLKTQRKKGTPSGYASLDASGKVPSSQLPVIAEHTHANKDILDKITVGTAVSYDLDSFGDMKTSVYDTTQNGIVDNAEKVNGFTVAKNVPSDAKFTDTITDISGKADKSQVLTNVPANAKFTDTNTITSINGKTGVITKDDITSLGIPAQDTIVDITGKADKTYVDNKVLTNVPANAKFTDTNTITTVNGKTGVITKDDITALGIPAQDTIVDINGKVDKVTGKGLSSNDYTTTDKNKLTGLENYTHPTTHPYSMITGGPTSLPASDVSAWAKAGTKPSYTKNRYRVGECR